MIKCEVIREFTLEEFDKLKNIQRKKADTKGKLYVGDTFQCEEKMADYLTGNNKNGDVVIKIIEIKPKEVIKAEEKSNSKKKKKKIVDIISKK